MDSPDQGLSGIPCGDIHTNGKAFSFTVPMVSGTWSGVVEGNGASLVGTWSQGGIVMPQTLVRVGVAATPGPISGALQTSATFPSGDFTQNGFRFHPIAGGGFVQVVDDNK